MAKIKVKTKPKLPKAKLGKDVDPFMQNAIGNKINYWNENNANGDLPQQINLGNVGGRYTVPPAQDYGDIDESQFGQQNPNYLENPLLTQEIVKEPDYKNSLKLKNQIEDYRNPASKVNFKKPSLSMFPTMGNKYLNRGMQYLNQSIAHANAIGTDPNSWEQPLNYQNGISNNPFLSTDVNKKYTTLRPKQDTYTLPTEDVQLPETQQSLTPKLTKFGDGGNLKNAYTITADALSLFPPTSVAGYVMGLPTTAYDMYQDYQKGDNKQLALDAMGLIPAFKLMKYSKFAKSATQGINMASKFNKAVDVANMANDVNQTIEKKELGGKSTYKKTMGDGGRQPIIVNDKNDPRLQAYNDSLDIYNKYPNNKYPVEDKFSTLSYVNNNIKQGKDSKVLYPNLDFANQNKIKPTKLEWAQKGYGNFTDEELKKGNWVHYISNGSSAAGVTRYFTYKKPVQPIIYQENRPKEPTFELNQEQQYLPQEEQRLEFDPIGLKKGTYFTRPRQQQEAGQGKLDYFDSKTGKLIKTMGDGGMNQNQFNNLQALGTGVNATQSGINFGKGITDIMGTQLQNNQIQNMENQLYTQSVFSGAIDTRPQEQYGYSWQGRNSLAENGMQIKEIGGQGIPSVEVEGDEHIKLPNGFSQEIKGKSHSEGGIPLNLPPDSKVFSEKLKIETLKGKKSYSDLAKPFETKKDFEMMKAKHGDDIQKRTAEMIIKFKNNKLEQLFELQEKNKLGGLHSKQVQKETMEEYQQPEMAFGGNIMTERFSNLPMAGSGLKTKPENTFTGVNKGIDFKTLRLSENSKNRRNNFLPFDPTNTPDIYGDLAYRESAFKEFEDRTGIKLNRANSDAVNLESIRKYQNARTPELTKDYKLNFTRGNQDLYNEFTKQKGYKKSKDSTKESNAFYDWAVANKKLNKDYADSGKWGHEYYNTAPLNFETEEEYNKWKQDPDWEQVGNRFVDRSGDPNGMITYYDIHKNWKTPSTKKTEGTPVTNEVQKIVDRQPEYNINPNMDIQFPLPNVYGRTPLNYYQTDPNYINPRYLDVQPQLNEVSRGQRAFQNNLGSRGNTEMGNLLQSQANAYNQQNQIFGNKFNYDRNQDSQTQQFNANAKTQNDMYNQGTWYNQLEDPIRRRESNIGVQQLTDQYRGQERADQALAFKNTKEFMDKDYSYFTNLSPEAQVAYMEVLSKQKQPTKKYGGKVKIKPTLKKKK